MAYHTTTSDMLLPIESIGKSLHFVGKRYVPEIANAGNLTLLFLHCTGSHKEVWEPIIQRIFTLKHPETDSSVIREAWSFDWQSHGESAVLNEELLCGLTSGLSVRDWAEGLKAFAATGVFDGHTLVAVGHSSGVSAMLLSTIASRLPAITYRSFIVIEPSLITRSEFNAHLTERAAALELMFKAVTGRRDVWNTREEAMQYFKKRLPWKIWDDQVLNLFVTHALCEIQTEEHNKAVTKVTLCCSKLQERTAFDDNEPHFTAVEILSKLDASVPVYFVLGTRYDLVPKYAHDSIIALRQPASIEIIPRAGHFVVQESPSGVTSAIARALSSLSVNRSRL